MSECKWALQVNWGGNRSDIAATISLQRTREAARTLRRMFISGGQKPCDVKIYKVKHTNGVMQIDTNVNYR
ncbi:hypothetical protein [Escherichia phage EK010]|uniref:Uncharacterized protein n=1 Tax=Escherichia phage EK010 TaxID=2742112 RepID=A0A6J4EGF1_9CAUD|nr:hypothetical protein PQC42_gp079 [Escherichia phage EK010]UYE89965.1 hypothetical protein [Escherichia phage E20-1]BCG44984.1 hypothetical protein [Escherichia phage EK010]